MISGMTSGMKTIIEPFRIKSVEPIRMTTAAERRAKLRAAGYNLFNLAAEDVLIDLLTDSGTGAMSANQWAAIMRGDESYAGAPSFRRFETAVRALMPFKHILPTHQGRAAEMILCALYAGPGKIIPSNTHFDTTRANIEAAGAMALDLPTAESRDTSAPAPFKGNMDVAALAAFLAENHAACPLVMLTITNNAGGGQPVSLANIRAVAALARRYDKPFFIDGCRFAENAWFIKTREKGQGDRPIPEIVRACFAVADGMTMSAKKDGFANIGGWLAMNDDRLSEVAKNKLIQTEGFPTYGGLAGRDLEAMAVGLGEIVDEHYLRYRIRSQAYIVERLDALGVPVVKPAGGHAVFIDAKRWLPHIPPLHYPGQVVACALYEAAGIRACEIGSVMFGRQADGSEKPAALELVRLAFPRRTYTQAHADYIVESFTGLVARAADLRGLRLVHDPGRLRHFTCRFSPRAA